MIVDFLWQEALIFGTGVGLARAHRFGRTRLLHRRLVAFFGADVVSVVVQAFQPLTGVTFHQAAEKTIALTATATGELQRLPIYGPLLHLDDYRASQQIVELLHTHGGHAEQVTADSDVLARWSTYGSVVCIGSPFTNAALAEAIAINPNVEGPTATASRLSDTLDSIRIEVLTPDRLVLGVESERAIAVIARLPNPSRRGWVVGVWGCRAESTRAAARFLRFEFRTVLGWTDPGKPLVALLAVRGSTFGVVDPMYVTSGSLVLQRDDLLEPYRRGDG